MRSLTIIAIILFSISSYGQDARTIVNHYLDTVSNGNINHWNKIKSIYTESEEYYSQNDYQQKVNFLKPDRSNFHKSFRVLPYQYKIEIYEDSSFTKRSSTFYYLKNKTIIRIGNTPPIIKQPPPRDEFFSAHLPVKISKLMGKSESVELSGIKEFPEEKLSCFEIKMRTQGRDYILYINKETFLLEYWSGGDGDPTILRGLKNYKRVDGLLMPMSELMKKNGVVFSRSDTKKIEINPGLDPKIFEYAEKD